MQIFACQLKFHAFLARPFLSNAPSSKSQQWCMMVFVLKKEVHVNTNFYSLFQQLIGGVLRLQRQTHRTSQARSASGFGVLYIQCPPHSPVRSRTRLGRQDQHITHDGPIEYVQNSYSGFRTYTLHLKQLQVTSLWMDGILHIIKMVDKHCRPTLNMVDLDYDMHHIS